MAIRKTKMTALLIAAVGMALCLAGCKSEQQHGTFRSLRYFLCRFGAVELSEAVSFSEESVKELTEDARLHYWLDGTTSGDVRSAAAK